MVEDAKGLKICVASDFDFKMSGYFNIATACARGLAERGHEVKCVGLGYNGEEHTFPFGIIPARNAQEVFAIITNIKALWQFDVLIVAMDIPVQEMFLNFIKQSNLETKYIGIMPVESDPLCISWALLLMQMNKALVISEFGTEEARKVGVDAVHIPIGIDTEAWRSPQEDEREAFRKALGFGGDDFVVLTVAYNQERKFLSRSMEIYAEFAKKVPNSKYVMVTAEHSPVGWKLRDLAQELGIADKFVLFERGIEHKRLWGIYAASDCFLLTSKAEGLGMIFMEAMSVGLPCIGTDCTGIHELLGDGRGFLIPYDYTIIDPFGNGKRYYANIEEGVKMLEHVHNPEYPDFLQERIEDAKEYINSRTWDKAVDVLENAIKEVVNG